MNRRGFTLVEMLITVTILAIVAGAAITAAGSRGTEVLESSAQVLAADLALARSLAIQQGTEWTLTLDVPNAEYEVRHTGAGTAAPIFDPLAPGPRTGGVYRIELSRLGMHTDGDNGVRIAGGSLAVSGSSVNDVTFAGLGGTGPARSEDTVLRLIDSAGNGTRAIDVTVSWITGQAWIGEPRMLSGP